MLSSARKASLRAWSEGVKYCWRLEDRAEDDPAVPPDQSISREAGAWHSVDQGRQTWADHGSVRTEETQTDTGQWGHSWSQQESSSTAVSVWVITSEEGETQVFHPRARSQGHESCQEQLQCWHMREEFRESPDLVGIESTLLHSTSAVKKW